MSSGGALRRKEEASGLAHGEESTVREKGGGRAVPAGYGPRESWPTAGRLAAVSVLPRRNAGLDGEEVRCS